MQDTPPGWPRLSVAIYYEDADTAIDWLCRAFGFELRLRVDAPDGKVEHSELVYGGAVVMVGDTRPEKREKYPYRRAPNEIGGANTQSIMIYVDDVEAHCERARAAGAKIEQEPETTNYGEAYWTDRGYACEDIGGHHWWFYQRLRNRGA